MLYIKNIAVNDAVVIALGSNLRGRYRTSRDLLEAALRRLPEATLNVTCCSRWWRSAAWPDTTQPDYLNGVALVETALSPREVLDALLGFEAEFGRVRGGSNAPRTLDLDLIAHGRTILDQPGLIVPHPRAHERRFVMGPLAEVAPEWVHPRLGLSAGALADSAIVGRDAQPLHQLKPKPTETWERLDQPLVKGYRPGGEERLKLEWVLKQHEW